MALKVIMALTEPAFRPSGLVWLRDFTFGWTALTVRRTGARVSYSPSAAAEAGAWLRYFFAVRAATPIGASFTIAYTPERARPWYLIWPVARLAGARGPASAAQADVLIHFDDATRSAAPSLAREARSAKRINFRCMDVSKTRVADAFETAFGYPLALDPAAHRGPAVEKSETNGAHDGRIVRCPAHALPGRAYQRVIDNRSDDAEMVEDLRTCTVGGRPVCVFIKRRPLAKRFQNTNSEVVMRTPDDVFSAVEISRIGAFTGEIGMDWGALDVLRDRGDGRIYIVDANKTDMGPPIALPLADKLSATRKLAAAFRDFVGAH
jgi:hypothetical protein